MCSFFRWKRSRHLYVAMACLMAAGAGTPIVEAVAPQDCNKIARYSAMPPRIEESSPVHPVHAVRGTDEIPACDGAYVPLPHQPNPDHPYNDRYVYEWRNNPLPRPRDLPACHVDPRPRVARACVDWVWYDHQVTYWRYLPHRGMMCVLEGSGDSVCRSATASDSQNFVCYLPMPDFAPGTQELRWKPYERTAVYGTSTDELPCTGVGLPVDPEGV